MKPENAAIWEWRLNVLRKLRKQNRTNLPIRHLQTTLINDIEYDLKKLKREGKI